MCHLFENGCLHIELYILISAHHLITVYICIKFQEKKNLGRFSSYRADTISILIITMGHYSVNIARGVIVLVLYILSNHDLHLYHNS